MQIILILSLLHVEKEAMAYIDINVKETPFSVTVLQFLLDSIIYFSGRYTRFYGNICGSLE